MSVANANVVLSVGSRGPEVGNLQMFLRDFLEHSGLGLKNGQRLIVDEMFGEKTAKAISQFQESDGLPVTGKFDVPTRFRATMIGFIPFIQARHCRVLWPRRKAKNLIVIHTIECSESNYNAAEDNALWMAGKTRFPAPAASAHYFIDQDSTVQGVRETDEAWHANEANERGIGIEHAGFAKQTTEEWKDDSSTAILERSARLCARLVSQFRIPIEKLDHFGVFAGNSGFCGHVDVTKAYNHPSGHTDPGPNFPWPFYLSLVEKHFKASWGGE